jgi:glycosyltransferase involved in cell wall biosynthesis
MSTSQPLVAVRTPTYKRPDMLRRALQALQAQTHAHWVCDVYDDDPDGAGEAVVSALNDPRIAWHRNQPQRFASKNIDQCFSRNNPRDADWFFVLEDDNLVLPRFMEANIATAREHGVELVFRNQLVEFAAGTPEARFSTDGVLDNAFREMTYEGAQFRLSCIAGIGVSNGGLFWSRNAMSDLEVHGPCSATFQEYLRTFLIADRIHVAMEPLGVWAENGAGTTRDVGGPKGGVTTRMQLAKSIQLLRIAAWELAGDTFRDSFETTADFRYPREKRVEGLSRALLPVRDLAGVSLKQHLGWSARALLSRAFGDVEPALAAVIASQRLRA